MGTVFLIVPGIFLALVVFVVATVSGVTMVYGVTVASRAYDQLRTERAERMGLPEPDEAEF